MLQRTIALLTLVSIGLNVHYCEAQDTALAKQSKDTATALPAKIGKFPQEVRTFYGSQQGLGNSDVHCVTVDSSGNVLAGTAGGLYQLRDGKFQLLDGSEDLPIHSVAVNQNGDGFALSGKNLYRFNRSDAASGGTVRVKLLRSIDGLEGPGELRLFDDEIWVLNTGGLQRFKFGKNQELTSVEVPAEWKKLGTIRAVAVGQDLPTVLGTDEGAFQVASSGDLTPLFPEDDQRRWAPRPIIGLETDGQGRLWMTSPQGLAVRDQSGWHLYEGKDGLPYNDFTSLAAGSDGTVWMGTSMGAIRFDGDRWYYRQGKRWLPSDHARDIALDASGAAWIATPEGLSQIHFQWMTLGEKAEFYETEIDRYHRRTDYGYVLGVSVAQPGIKEGIQQHDSDNDGLWTAMYGVGECYAYAATKSADAKRRARQAFEALRFLQTAPEGCEHEPPRGFVARTVVPTDQPDPNQREAYTLEGQKKRQASQDRYWRVYEPRWPKTKDGAYYWKSDTSSDELDGHFYFFPLYYDLVAETEQEKAEVREVVVKMIDHLIKYDFLLVDHAGPTRWGVYDPATLNGDPEWFAARGIKSLSILSYLNAAFHMTGDPVYRQHHVRLRDQHHYFLNTLWTEYQRGFGSGNQSDDEMFLMGFYNLIKYEPDPEFRQWYISAFSHWWRLEESEMNPYFNFAFAALAKDEETSTIWGAFDMSPAPGWLEDAIETLKRFPLDRFDWRHQNSHRLDILPLPNAMADPFENRFEGKGYLVNGKVLPVDERHFNHWNHDPWSLDTGGEGRYLACGSVYTLSYYTGLYYGFIQD
jgi:hypothetical protein